MLEDSLEERLEKTGGLLSDTEKAEGDTKEGELEENKVLSFKYCNYIHVDMYIYKVYAQASEKASTL